MKKIPLSKPELSGNEYKYLKEVLESGTLSIGPWLRNFEEQIARYAGVTHAVGVNSGTSALHLIVRSLGLAAGDEVITTPFSFIASSNCILFENATPVFVDIDDKTLNMDISLIESAITEKTKAILAVDVFGQPADIAAIRKIADKYKLYVIEDAAEALGSISNGHKAGSLADAAVFAFYPNKQITTAEGGVVITNDDKLAELCRSMRSQGRSVTGQWLDHERLGYNYRLSELHAALGVAQMERIDEMLKKRKAAAEYYIEKLEKINSIRVPYVADNVTFMSWFVYVIRVPANIRNDFLDYLVKNGIDCKPYFTPIHTQPFYTEKFGFKRGMFPETDKAGDTCVAIPFYTDISRDDIDYVADVISNYF